MGLRQAGRAAYCALLTHDKGLILAGLGAES